jgi:ADP-ribose pyrophosphatase YjhB (NUDIX family)
VQNKSVNKVIMSYIRKIRAKMGSECVFNPGVRAIILNDREEVLLQRRTDMDLWGLPAGGVELNETALDALKREVFEETGVTVLAAEPMALYSGPTQRLKYPNGDEIQGFALAFIIREWTGEPCADGEEGSEVRFWSLDDLPENIMDMHIGVLKDFCCYNGKFMLAPISAME